jgi:hypothetical protein
MQTSPSSPSGSRKNKLRTGPKSVTKPSLAPRSTSRRRISSKASSEAACRARWSSEHRRLPGGLLVAVELEDVELGVRPDTDERQPHPVARPQLSVDGRFEHIPVKGDESVGIGGQDRNVVEPVE